MASSDSDEADYKRAKSGAPHDWRPRPDPTDLTTDQLRRELNALRELLEARLDGMDMATRLLAEQVTRIPQDTDDQRAHLREDIKEELLAIRELFLTRITSMDKATVLLAEKLEAQRSLVRSDIDGQMVAQREVLETRLAAMDKATELLAATVGRVPSETDKATNALRELLGARIDGMDTATKLLAAQVDALPSDIDRSATSLREFFAGLSESALAETRRVGDVTQEKFAAIDGLFNSNDKALTAALAAQEKAAAEQQKSNTLAIDKSEKTTQETIRANDAKTASSIEAQGQTIADIKERVVRIESTGVGSSAQRSEHRLDIGQVIAAIAVIVALASVLVLVLKK